MESIRPGIETCNCNNANCTLQNINSPPPPAACNHFEDKGKQWIHIGDQTMGVFRWRKRTDSPLGRALILLSLLFWNSLFSPFARNSLFFFSIFPFILKDLWGTPGKTILAFSLVFIACFCPVHSKEKEIRERKH